MDGLALGSKGSFMVRLRTGSPGQERALPDGSFVALACIGFTGSSGFALRGGQP